MAEPLVFEAPGAALPVKKPWERQDGESARWHMRFKRYLAGGHTRSVNAVYEAERREKQGKPSNKISACWYEAARRWNWEARAEAWDEEQGALKAALMRQIAQRSPFVSRPFRIVELNALATSLMRHLEPGQEPTVYLAIAREMRALLLDIKAEVAEWGCVPDAECDAAALDAYNAKGQRLAEYQEDRELDQEAELDRLLQRYEAMQQMTAQARATQMELEKMRQEAGQHHATPISE